MISDTLNQNEYDAYYRTYIDKATNVDIVEGLNANLEAIVSFFKAIPTEKHNYAYVKDKWSVKDIILHLIDTERIFAYRALRIARKDQTPLAGYEQDDYIDYNSTKNRTLDNLLSEYKAVRSATITLFNSFDNDVLGRIGIASNCPFSVRAIGYIIQGHENHHINIIKERYL